MGIVDQYLGGKSTTDIAKALSIPISTVRRVLLEDGVLRTRAEGVRLAASQGKIGAESRGKTRTFTSEWKENIRKSRLKHGEEHAMGTRTTSQGYQEFTRGPSKGRRVHDVLIEETIGRSLRRDECVHHLNGDRSDNRIENLQLMSASHHARLHRLSEPFRKRDEKGKFLCQ
jgi:hypothetical protein